VDLDTLDLQGYSMDEARNVPVQIHFLFSFHLAANQQEPNGSADASLRVPDPAYLPWYDRVNTVVFTPPTSPTSSREFDELTFSTTVGQLQDWGNKIQFLIYAHASATPTSIPPYSSTTNTAFSELTVHKITFQFDCVPKIAVFPANYIFQRTPIVPPGIKTVGAVTVKNESDCDSDDDRSKLTITKDPYIVADSGKAFEVVSAFPKGFPLPGVEGIEFCGEGKTLDPGQSCPIFMLFSPVNIGLHTARLVIESNDPTMAKAIVDLAGEGTRPEEADTERVRQFKDWRIPCGSWPPGLPVPNFCRPF
jgi:hypothetical protein